MRGLARVLARPSVYLRLGGGELSRARASEELLDGGNRALVLADDRIRVKLLPDRGADIHAVEDLRTGVDVLWKTPWGLRRRGGDNVVPRALRRRGSTRMREAGRCCSPRAVGPRAIAASTTPTTASVLAPWAATIAATADGGDSVELRVRLAETPLLVERVVSLAPRGGEVVVAERVTNEGDRPVEYMWVHHPAFGAPLVAPGARIRTPRRRSSRTCPTTGPAIHSNPEPAMGGRSCRLETVASWTCRSSPPHHPAGCFSAIWEASPRGRQRSKTMPSISPARCPGTTTCSVRLAVAGARRHRRSSVARARLHDRDRAGDELPGHRARRRRREQCHAPHPRCRRQRSDAHQPSPLRRRASVTLRDAAPGGIVEVGDGHDPAHARRRCPDHDPDGQCDRSAALPDGACGSHNLVSPSRQAARSFRCHRRPARCLIAQPGFSALVRVTTGARERAILFDTGVTPTGRREHAPARDPAGRHRDDRAQPWSLGPRRRDGGNRERARTQGTSPCSSTPTSGVAGDRHPGPRPAELPVTSRSALEGAGFEIVETNNPRSCSTAPSS